MVKTKTPQAQVLRDKLIRALKNQTHEMVEVKESFHESTEAVQFSLLYKTTSQPQWQSLVSLERPRLKTARLAAYEAALKNTSNTTKTDATD